MGRTLSIFIPLYLLVLNILFCTGTKTIQIQVINPNQYGSEVMASSQPELKKKQISYLLISPTPASFKYHILPYLPSENVIKIYDHFRKSYLKLDLEKWLEGFIINPVVDFTDSFKKKILFRSPYQSPSFPILYSQKTKHAVTVPNLDFILLPDNICAFLESTQKIVPFVSKAVSPDQHFLGVDDPTFGTLYVCDEQFLTIAHGKLSTYEFWENENNENAGWYVKYIWEAKNLNSYKKFLIAVRYFVTLPFIKYLKCISPLLDSAHAVWMRLESICGGYTSTLCGPIFLWLWFIFLYIYIGFIFHTITLPFHALALPLELFVVEENYFSLFIHWVVRLSLFLPYSLFFPKFIDGLLINDLPTDGNYTDKIKLNSHTSEPKSEMWSFSFLIPRKRPCEFYIWIVFWEIFLSLILKFGFKNWIPCEKCE